MEVIFACVFLLVLAMVTFYEPEKRKACSQKKLVASSATAYPKPDVKSGNPDAESADPGHTLNIPDTFIDCLNKPAIRLYRFKRSALPTIPENLEGEDHVAEIEKLVAEMKKTKSDMRQEQQTTQKDMEQLRQQVTDLMAERDDLTQQLVQEKRMQKLCMPITIDVGCGSDALQVAVASTQTESISKDVGSGTQVIPPQTRTNQQESTKDQSCGFVLDFQMMERCRNPRRSFYVPARERTKSSAVPAAAPKAQVHFPVGDVRYKNKPMSGYVVNSDGTQVIYGDAVQSTQKHTHAIPTKNTEAAGPSPVLEQPKEKPRTTKSPVNTDELIVTSAPVERLPLPGNRLLLKNIPSGDSGRIIGCGGSNIRRIETEYRVVAGVNTSPDGDLSLLITGSSEQMRQEAADDIIRGLTVTAEFANLKLSKPIRNKRLFEIGKKFFVRINRPSPTDTDGKMTLVGKLTSCQSAYAELLAEIIY